MVRSAGKALLRHAPAPAGYAPCPEDGRQIRLKAARPVAFPGQAGKGQSLLILTVASELLEALRAGEGVDLVGESVGWCWS
jgi:hypothetical protein